MRYEKKTCANYLHTAVSTQFGLASLVSAVIRPVPRSLGISEILGIAS